MHHNHFEAIQCLQKLAYLLTKDDYASCDVSVHPPFTDVRSVQTLIDADELKVSLGAQHCHWEDKGAFTGEISAAFLNKLNVEYVICGHSERRELFGESDEDVAKKITAIHKNKMTPIVCVGETLAEREAGLTTNKVMGQVRSALAGRTAEQVSSMVIAYEPIWAIGTGLTATSEQAQEAHRILRKKLALIDSMYAQRVLIIYGGSVKASNAAELLSMSDIDGLLVGGASLVSEEFITICQAGLNL
jgi:triosephosphate isomerase